MKKMNIVLSLVALAAVGYAVYKVKKELDELADLKFTFDFNDPSDDVWSL